MGRRGAFTLVEVLISITLLTIVFMALYRSVDILRASNRNLFSHLERSSIEIDSAKVLYMDILMSDGNISISSDRDRKFSRVTIFNSRNSLYGLSSAKVAWLVYKEDNTLIRVEGGDYDIPLKYEDRVEIDIISKGVEQFNIYLNRKKTKALAIIKFPNLTQTFMVNNIPTPRPKLKLVKPTELGKKQKRDPYIPPLI
ncbi:MAG: prepilin-type N-terminal cleavage/methylation domain-containing protein [Epsilonproteobacteria bacterium]|nr:prepilin-type N-terminal cleavage/methylation domain-containing protein [Campylobacterota bacterium]